MRVSMPKKYEPGLQFNPTVDPEVYEAVVTVNGHTLEKKHFRINSQWEQTMIWASNVLARRA